MISIVRKEFSRNFFLIFALILLTSLVMGTTNQFIKPLIKLAVIFLTGLLVGAVPFCGEINDGTKNFIASIPVTKRTIWGAKILFSLISGLIIASISFFSYYQFSNTHLNISRQYDAVKIITVLFSTIILSISVSYYLSLVLDDFIHVMLGSICLGFFVMISFFQRIITSPVCLGGLISYAFFYASFVIWEKTDGFDHPSKLKVNLIVSVSLLIYMILISAIF